MLAPELHGVVAPSKCMATAILALVKRTRAGIRLTSMFHERNVFATSSATRMFQSSSL